MVMVDGSLFVTVPVTVVPSFKASVAIWPAEVVVLLLLHPARIAKAKQTIRTGCFISAVPPFHEITACEHQAAEARAFEP
jgi:hypothetical protein